MSQLRSPIGRLPYLLWSFVLAAFITPLLGCIFGVVKKHMIEVYSLPDLFTQKNNMFFFPPGKKQYDKNPQLVWRDFKNLSCFRVHPLSFPEFKISKQKSPGHRHASRPSHRYDENSQPQKSPKGWLGGSLIFGWYFLKPPNHFLGGGFNPFEKY